MIVKLKSINLLSSFRFKGSILLFLIIISISFLSFHQNKQLELMGGLAEEYFVMGWNLSHYGEYFPGENTTVLFRPPGYPVFIAGVLKIWEAIDPAKSDMDIEHGYRVQKAMKAVILAQAILFAVTCAILFLWMTNHLLPLNAFVLSLLFGINPYCQILIGYIHYPILHVFMTILSCYALDVAFQKNNENKKAWLISGMSWGLTTLTRPMTLILPPFIFFMHLIKSKFSWRASIIVISVFVLGMFISIAPYSLRNYILTNKLVIINSQGGMALWSGTLIKLKRDPNHYKWFHIVRKQKELLREEGKNINLESGIKDKNYFKIFLTSHIEADKQCFKKAMNNIRSDPKIYAYNFLQNFISFNIDINSALIKIFQATKGEDSYSMKQIAAWLYPGDPQVYHSNINRQFDVMIWLFALLGFLGVFFSIRRNDMICLVPFTVYLCFCIAHSITYLDFMYYYIKVPFVFIFAWYFIDQISRKKPFILLRNVNISVPVVMNSVLCLWIIAMTVWVLFIH